MEKNNKKAVFCPDNGFTLIELLVAVLIIGILAAVALPQYNKAVKRAQGREVYVAIKALDKALADYYLEHGDYKLIQRNSGTDKAENLDKLSVQIPALKYSEYKYYSGGYYSSQAFLGCSSASAQSNGVFWGCMVSIKMPNNSEVSVSWEDGKRKEQLTRIYGKDSCQYFDGAIEQLQTPSSTFTYCVVQF